MKNLSFLQLLIPLSAITFVYSASFGEHHDHKSKSDSVKHDHDGDTKNEQTEHRHSDKDDKHAEDDTEANKEQGHTEEEGGGHEEEATQNVGPDKGIISFDEENGFVLSPEASKTFDIKTQSLTGVDPWVLPRSCLLETGDEKNIFRVRKGVFKRVDIVVVKKDQSNFTFTSKELVNGDEVVANGVGFLRVAELDVTSGESGHHH